MKDLKNAASNTAVTFVKSFVAPEEAEVDRTTIKGSLQDLMMSIRRVDIFGMGAQLAYFFLLSFFPLIIFLVTLLPYLHLKQEQVLEFMADIMPLEVYKMIEGTLLDVLTHQNSGLLSIGIIGTIWSASRGINALMKALNRAYKVEGKAGVIHRAWSLIFTIAFVFIILIALVFPVFGHQLGNLLFSYFGVGNSFGSVWNVVRWITPPMMIFFIMIIMYWVVPNTNPRLKLSSVIPGACFSTVGWLILTSGFSIYINNFGNYSATYGSIGGVIILMLWLYATGMLLIFGGLINATMQRRQLALKTKYTEL